MEEICYQDVRSLDNAAMYDGNNCDTTPAIRGIIIALCLWFCLKITFK
jgi:hypothetical protein